MIRRETLIIIILFTVLTLIMTYPLIFNMGSAVKDRGDPLLNSWILAWNCHKIAGLDISHIFNGNIFYPHERTIAYSEFLLTQSLVALPVLFAVKNPIFAKNFVLLFSLITSGLGMYFLARYLTKNIFAGITAGAIYAFSPFIFGHLSHLQVLTAGGIPLAFLFLHKFFKNESYKNLLLFSLFFLLQALANGYYGLYLSLFAGLYILLYIILRKKLGDWRFWIKIATLLIIILTVALPVFLQYTHVRKEMGFVRKIDFSANLISFLASSPENRLYGHLTSRFLKYEGALFPGILAVMLAAAGFIFMQKKNKGKILFIQTPVHFYTVMLLLSFLFTFGRNGPYLFLYKFVPGFKNIRVASRFHVLVMCSLAVLAAYGVKAILFTLARAKKRQSPVIVFPVICLILIEYLCVPVYWESVPVREEIPEVYKWLANKEGDFAVLELPLPKMDEHAYKIECPRMYYSTYHWKKLVNGYSGYFPPLYYELRRRLADEPLEQNIADLKNLGVKYVIFHSALYERDEFERILSGISNLENQIQFIKQLDDASVYELIYCPKDRQRVPLDVKSRIFPKDDWTADSNVNRGDAAYAVDGDISTRWSSGPQKRGTYFELDLDRIHRIKGLSLKLGDKPLDYPRGYRVELSTNAVEWITVAQQDKTALPLTAFLRPTELAFNIIFSPEKARYIRIVNTREDEIYHWSIYEIDVIE
jgi:hypothetical protein